MIYPSHHLHIYLYTSYSSFTIDTPVFIFQKLDILIQMLSHQPNSILSVTPFLLTVYCLPPPPVKITHYSSDSTNITSCVYFTNPSTLTLVSLFSAFVNFFLPTLPLTRFSMLLSFFFSLLLIFPNLVLETQTVPILNMLSAYTRLSAAVCLLIFSYINFQPHF